MSHKRYLETINALKDLGIKIAIIDVLAPSIHL